MLLNGLTGVCCNAILLSYPQQLSSETYFKETGVTMRQPVAQLSQEAVKILSENDQEKLLHEGNRFLLTEDALRKFDLMTGALVLREFACRPCDYFWWRTVPRTKPVSTCPVCKVKYDALPREKEFGTGRYKCTNCDRFFFDRCEATSERPCFKCRSTVRVPYIHPKFIIRARRPVALQSDEENYVRVINASTEHDSTGSTTSTFITQRDIPVFRTRRRSQPLATPTGSDDDTSSSELESDSEQSSVSLESEIEVISSDTESSSGALAGSDSSSDSDDADQPLPQKRSSASSSSDSDSDSDDKDKGKTSKGQSKPSSPPFEKLSIPSTSSDSGHGTCTPTGSSMATKSSGGSEEGKSIRFYMS